MSHEKFRKLSKESGVFTDVSMEFQEKIMERSGLGDCTHLPAGMKLHWHRSCFLAGVEWKIAVSV